MSSIAPQHGVISFLLKGINSLADIEARCTMTSWSLSLSGELIEGLMAL